MKKQLIIDCDGVLLDPVWGFIKWFIFNFPNVNVARVIKNNASFINEVFISFWNSSDFSKIPVLKSSRYPIEFLKSKYSIDVVTSCGDDLQKRNARIKNLERYFGKNTFQNIYTLPFNKSKKDIYRTYSDGIIIDDELKNIVDAQDCNSKFQTFWMSYHPVMKLLRNDQPEIEKTNIKRTNWKNIISTIAKSNIR